MAGFRNWERDEKEKFSCLTTDCPGDKHCARGLCKSCYLSAAIMVRNGKVTWGELERRDLALTPFRRQRSLLANLLEQSRSRDRKKK